MTPIGPLAGYVIAGPRLVATPLYQTFVRVLSDAKSPAAGSTGPQNVQGSPVALPERTWISWLEGKGTPRSLFQRPIGAFYLGHDLLLGLQPVLLFEAGREVALFGEEKCLLMIGPFNV